MVRGISCGQATALLRRYFASGVEPGGWKCAASAIVCWRGASYENANETMEAFPAVRDGVQVNAPDARVCIEGTAAIEVGVRWRPDLGPRRFQIELYDRRGKLVLFRRGLASGNWRTWQYDPPALPIYGGNGPSAYPVGVYRTIYTTASGTSMFRTRVVFCGD